MTLIIFVDLLLNNIDLSHYVYFVYYMDILIIKIRRELIKINYKEIYNLHIQLLNVYERNQKRPHPYQKDINFYHRQLNFFVKILFKRFLF